jgi:hypothetical protein
MVTKITNIPKCDYKTWAEEYNPLNHGGKIKILLVGESPPPLGKNFECRYFYNKHDIDKNTIAYRISKFDYFGFHGKDWTPEIKDKFLRSFCNKGFFLTDLCESRMSEMNKEEKDRRFTIGKDKLLEDIKKWRPNAIIVIKSDLKQYIDPIEEIMEGSNICFKYTRFPIMHWIGCTITNDGYKNLEEYYSKSLKEALDKMASNSYF